MKKKILVSMYLTIALMIFSACNDGGTTKTDIIMTNTTDTTAKVTETKDNELIKIVTYSGVISDIDITMTLNYFGDGTIDGSYWYNKYKQEIHIYGTFAESEIILSTDDESEEFVGEIQNEIISGKWRSGDRTFEFYLEENENAKRPRGVSEIVIKNIPESFDEGLIEELANAFATDEYYSVLEKYAVEDITVNINDLNIITNDTYSPLTQGGDMRYLFDFNGDGVNELVNYYLEGSGGGCMFTITPEINGAFSEENSNFVTVTYGPNDVIKYNDKYYFVILETDLNYQNIRYINVLGLDEDFNLESCDIELEFKAVNYEIANVPTKEDEVIAESIMQDFDKYITINEYDYLEFADDSLNGRADVNNDGVLDELKFYIDYSSSVNRPTFLNYQDSQNEEELKTLQPIFDMLDEDETLQYFNVKDVDGQNYVYLITQRNGTMDLNLSIYHLKGTDLRAISDYFVYFDKRFAVDSFKYGNSNRYDY